MGRENQLVYTTYSDLSAKQEVIQLIQEQVNEINQSLPEKARVKSLFCFIKSLMRTMKN